MGTDEQRQSYVLANLDREEYFDPRYLGGGREFDELLGSTVPSAVVYLLHESDATETDDDVRAAHPNLGRWADDRVIVIGDLDSSDLHAEVRSHHTWTEISSEIRDELNEYLGSADVDPDSDTGAEVAATVDGEQERVTLPVEQTLAAMREMPPLAFEELVAPSASGGCGPRLAADAHLEAWQGADSGASPVACCVSCAAPHVVACVATCAVYLPTLTPGACAPRDAPRRDATCTPACALRDVT
ncbi:hypothetical protein [Halalkalicoccus tibetensis]|uniref:Uncharacterized protein n=1 Tax=Halalkalicoccus tibetensis TaxID=175632 RepID=A0ABD5VCD8_9EURY